MEFYDTFTSTQWSVVLASLVVAGFALFAGMIYQLTSQGEVGSAYKTSVRTGAMLQGVAFLAYVVLTLVWIFGFNRVGNNYVPSSLHFDNGFRYVDWAVTVPLLMIELSAVLKLTGPARQKLRSILVPAALLMVVTGYVGTDPASNHDLEHGPLLVWGAISTVFFLIAFGVLFPAIGTSIKELPKESGTSLRNIIFLLSFTWGVYPIVYLFPVFFGTGSHDAATVRQILFSVTDIAAKAGYGVLIHKIAVQRTAQDVLAGDATHPEDIYLSGQKIADARPAVAVALVAMLATSGAPNGLTAAQGDDGRQATGAQTIGRR